jgi:hypothetical protein
MVDGDLIANGCTWYRCILPARAMAEQGWDTATGLPGVDGEWGLGVLHDGKVMPDADVTVLKLLMQRDIPAIVAEMTREGKHVVMDVDDFHAGLSRENVASAVTDPHQHPEANRAWYEQVIRAVDTVTVSTGFLANHYERRCRDVRIVRNAIDAERYTQRDVSGPMRLGWVGATPWRSGDLETLSGWLPGFLTDHDLGFHHAGHIDNDPWPLATRAGIDPARVTTEGMRLLPEYPEMFGRLNVGLVPLNLIPFNEAKSTIKGLEYAASGIPFIAAPTEEYLLLEAQGIGRVAWTPDEWRDHATDLMHEETRVMEGQRIRDLVLKHHTYHERGPEWVTALSG